MPRHYHIMPQRSSIDSNNQASKDHSDLQQSPNSSSILDTNGANSKRYIHHHNGDKQCNISTGLPSDSIINTQDLSNCSTWIPKHTVPNTWILSNSMDVGPILVSSHGPYASMGSLFSLFETFKICHHFTNKRVQI